MNARDLRFFVRATTAAILVLSASGTVRAQGILDQENDPQTNLVATSCGIGPGSLYQGFTPMLSPLIAVELRLADTAGSPPHDGDRTVRIRDGAPNGAVLGEAVATMAPGWVRFDFGPSGIVLTPGQLYIIEFVSPAPWINAREDTYANGNMYGCTALPILDRDASFRTYAPFITPTEQTTWSQLKSRYISERP